MTLPQNVKDALSRMDRWSVTDFDGECSHADDWQTIRAELHRLSEVESRLAAANALLKKALHVIYWENAALRSAIKSHLQGAGDET